MALLLPSLCCTGLNDALQRVSYPHIRERRKEQSMSNFCSVLFGAGAAILAASLVAGAAAQTPGKTPDFFSDNASWRARGGEIFIPVPGAPQPTGNDQAHAYIHNVDAERLGVQPTFRISDLTNPNIKQWAKDIMKKDNDEVLAGKIAYTPGSSCRPYGVPAIWNSAGPFLFVQKPREVLITNQGEQFARHVYMNVPHRANLKPSYYGESVGHYEGDALVIDTIGMNAKTFADNFRTPHTEKLHVIERIRRVEGGKKLEIHVTADDPDTFVQPWQGIRLYNLGQAIDRGEAQPGHLGVAESICQEGNLTASNLKSANYNVPVAGKPDF
jgi:hypothetical protein